MADNESAATVRGKTYGVILLCSALFIGCIPSPVRVVVEQPLAKAKATASPKQRLILVRRFSFIFITVSVFLLVICCCCERRVRKFTVLLVAPRTPAAGRVRFGVYLFGHLLVFTA